MGDAQRHDTVSPEAGQHGTRPDNAGLHDALRRAGCGDVLADPLSLGLYATDASLYEEEPLAVVLPRNEDHLRRAHEVARAHGASILPRGGGTSLAGQATGRAVVLDGSRDFNRLLELDTEKGFARVEPGIVRDELNARIASSGLHFAPETATSNRATIGGMIGNNSSGTRSILHGMTVAHVLELRVLLATGETLELGPRTADEWRRIEAQPDREGEIHRVVREVLEQNRDEIERRYPRLPRRVGGYNLDAFPAGESWNLARLVCGSEGTLATTLEANLRLIPTPSSSALLVVHYASQDEALRSVPRLLELRPSAVELLDRTLVEQASGNPEIRRMCDFLEGEPDTVLIVEMLGDSRAEVEARIHEAAAVLEREGVGYARPVRTDEAGIARVWNVRKAGLGVLMRMRGERKPLPFIEDAAVPVESLADYIQGVREICRQEEIDITMYAHASVGLLHVRPVIDLASPPDVARMTRISERTLDLVLKYGGAWSGEHGDGRVRSPGNERFFGPRLVDAFRRIKRAFDPEGLMNPGKIVDPLPMDEGLRRLPRDDHAETARFMNAARFHWREEGGLASAVELCSGVGACRKTIAGTMCPSYIATRDETHSTRGRANALRLAMTGKLGEGATSGEWVRSALDLCLGCKACATECPSGVDMARMKGEVLAAYHEREGVPAGTRFFAEGAARARKLAGPLAPFVNAVGRLSPVRAWLERRYGLDRRRPLPSVSNEPLSRWFAKRAGSSGSEAGDRSRVALFVDTYIGYHETRIGRAAVQVLERLGFAVELAEVGCCQRPKISLGLLDEARADGEGVLRSLDALAREGVPIVVVEPSCLSALHEDLPDLLDDVELGRRVASSLESIDAFVDRAFASRDEPERENGRGVLWLHGHCHQKAFDGTEATVRSLERATGRTVRVIDGGCCGMAGSFGYERAHHDLSLRIGEDRLFPALRERSREDIVVATGFSCRHQIRDALDVRPLHPVEILAEALASTPDVRNGGVDR